MKSSFRHRARKCVVQAHYSWQLSQNNITDIEYSFLTEYITQDIDLTYFHELLYGVITNSIYFDNLMKPYLLCQSSKLGQIEKAILHIALFELSKKIEIPYKVIINEAIKLAKIFGPQDSYKFINGVLDKAAFKIRF